MPERVYPGGYEVERGGGMTERAPGELHVLKPQAGETVTVTVHP